MNKLIIFLLVLLTLFACIQANAETPLASPAESQAQAPVQAPAQVPAQAPTQVLSAASPDALPDKKVEEVEKEEKEEKEEKKSKQHTMATIVQTGGIAGVHKTVKFDSKAGTANGKMVDEVLLAAVHHKLKGKEFKKLPDFSSFPPEHEVADAFIYSAEFEHPDKSLFWNEASEKKPSICDQLEQLVNKYGEDTKPTATAPPPKP